ncbi:MAG: hypothetical protein RIF41_06865 [Polyangiaceae bacterium]
MNSGLAFESDWSTGLGQGADALRDADKDKPWTTILDNGGLLEVVATASEGLDFPTANVLKITANNGGSGLVPAAQPQFRTQDGYVPIPAVGESIFYRYYLRVEVPDSYSDDPLTHGTQDADDFGLRNWQHEIVTRSDGTFDLRVSVTNSADNNPYPNHFWRVNLDKNTTYRNEHQLELIAPGQFALRAAVFDVDDRQVYSDVDFSNVDGVPLSAAAPLNLGSGGAAQLGAFRTGLNSLVGTHAPGTFPFTFAYVGGVAICRSTWCGPYDGDG